MTGVKNSFIPVNFFPESGFSGENLKKYFYGFCILFLVIAVLEFTQDYIDSLLNGTQFQLLESLSYKLFWILFIPFSLLMGYGLEAARSGLTGVKYLICNTLLVAFITLGHLFIFSLFLFGISNLIHDNPWDLTMLLTEKLSTRLYLALSANILLAAVYISVNQRRSRQESDQQEYRKTLPVKNGQKSVIVSVDAIKWISSDGPYLYIHTAEKKHIVVNSLKKIITRLPEKFKRIHRSTIVNIENIVELNSRLNGDYDVVLDDGRELRLSRNYTKPLKGLLL